jgi:hydroxymethylpyrimidine/phosphomethylpyrimidine kinase
VEIVAALLQAFKPPHVVLDPVLQSSSGTPLLDTGAVETLKTKLLPLAEVVTPNLHEASVLSSMPVNDTKDMQAAASALKDMGPANVIVTGGHLEGRPMDLLYDGRKHSVYDAYRIVSRNTHGTGDAFASAVACKLAMGDRLEVAIDVAKKYVAKAMNHPFAIGKGPHGPLNHGVPIT